MPHSTAFPLWLAFLEEGANALLGVGEGGVEGHDLFGVGVGLLRRHLELAVEGLLAQPHDERTGLYYLLRERPRLGIELLCGNHPVYEAFFEGFACRDELAREEHLHRLLLAYGAGEGDHRGRAEQPDAYTGRGKACFLGSHHEVTCSGELASCGRCRGVDLRYYGLRYLLNGLHQLAADVEDVAVEPGITPEHLREVVTRAEGRSLAAQDDDRGLSTLPDLLEARDQLLHVGEREGVALVRTVHGHVSDIAVLLEKYVLVGLLGLDHGASFKIGIRLQDSGLGVETLRRERCRFHVVSGSAHRDPTNELKPDACSLTPNSPAFRGLPTPSRARRTSEPCQSRSWATR